MSKPRFAGHVSGRGHGPGGRLEPQVGDAIEMLDRPGVWKTHIVAGHHLWRGRFDLDRDSGDCTVWRWPHKATIRISGPCCTKCLRAHTEGQPDV